MLKEEILKIIRRRQFIIIFTILFIVAILDFLVTCKSYYGSPLSYVRSAYMCSVLENEVPLFTHQLFSTLFPLVISIAVADVYYEEQTLGMNNFIYTRTNKVSNIKYKIISVILVAFFVTAIPVIANFLLTFTAFPVQGYYSRNSSYLTLTAPEKNIIFSYLEMYFPYVNILVYILIRCIIGSTFALFAFSVSVLNRFNHYMVLFSSMIFYILFSSISIIYESPLTQTNIFFVNGYGSVWMFVVFLVVTNLISAVFIVKGLKKESL